MTPQIIGNAKSKATRACERYCRERSLDYQLRDPGQKALGPREIETLAAAAGGAEHLIDTESRSYQKRGLAYMDYDAAEELSEDPALLRVPIVRTDHGIAIAPDTAELDRLFGRA